MPITYPIRQSTLAKKMGSYMDQVAKRGSQTAGSFPGKTLQMLRGMEFIANELGIDCECTGGQRRAGAPPYGRMGCKCRPMSARERAAGFGKTGGPHCRDEDGEFIPVPQCTRKLPADIRIATPPPAKRKRKKKRS